MEKDFSKPYLFLSCFQVLLGAGVTCGSLSLAYYTREGPGPGFFPFWTGMLLTGLGLILGCKTLISMRHSRRSGTPPAGEALFQWLQLKNVGVVIACLVLCIGLFKPIGFTIAIGLFTLILMRVVGEWGWLKSAVFSVVLSGGLFWVFKIGFSIPLPVGFWGF